MTTIIQHTDQMNQQPEYRHASVTHALSLSRQAPFPSDTLIATLHLGHQFRCMAPLSVGALIEDQAASTNHLSWTILSETCFSVVRLLGQYRQKALLISPVYPMGKLTCQRKLRRTPYCRSFSFVSYNHHEPLWALSVTASSLSLNNCSPTSLFARTMK